MPHCYSPPGLRLHTMGWVNVLTLHQVFPDTTSPGRERRTSFLPGVGGSPGSSHSVPWKRGFITTCWGWKSPLPTHSLMPSWQGDWEFLLKPSESRSLGSSFGLYWHWVGQQPQFFHGICLEHSDYLVNVFFLARLPLFWSSAQARQAFINQFFLLLSIPFGISRLLASPAFSLRFSPKKNLRKLIVVLLFGSQASQLVCLLHLTLHRILILFYIYDVGVSVVPPLTFYKSKAFGLLRLLKSYLSFKSQLKCHFWEAPSESIPQAGSPLPSPIALCTSPHNNFVQCLSPPSDSFSRAGIGPILNE